jgi:single-strand DNA-binding protein
MAGEPYITIVGNATADAELRFTPSGAAVCSFSVAQTPRVKQGDSWVDGEPTYYRCSAWRQLGESAAETITRGMRLIVHGRVSSRSYEKDGVKRTSLEVDVEAVGPELRYAIATVKKAERGSAKPAGQPGGDPWPTAPVNDDEAPF